MKATHQTKPPTESVSSTSAQKPDGKLSVELGTIRHGGATSDSVLADLKEQLPPTGNAAGHITGARQRIASVRQLLAQKAGLDGRFYSERKYVRLAGRTAWSGILQAIIGTLNVQSNLKKKQPSDIDDIRQLVNERDPEKLNVLNATYDTLYKSMGYDGNLSVFVVQEALSMADELIEWCESLANPEKPYIDPFLYEIGFFKDRSDRNRLIEKVRELNRQASRIRPKKA